MLSKRDLAAALVGVWRLMHLKIDGFLCFDATLDGFWKSYWAAVIALPPSILLIASHASGVDLESLDTFILAQAIGYAVSWLAYPLLMVHISQYLGLWPRYFTYMVSYNWFQIVQVLAWLPILILAMFGVPAPVMLVVSLAVNAALLFYSWFIARHGLGVDGITATALVIIDFLLSLLINHMADSLT
jgi:hypothetical protein